MPTAIGSNPSIIHLMGLRSCPEGTTRRSKSGIQVSWSHKMPVLPKSTPPGSSTGTLELKATKENAHSGIIKSIAFNPVDGKTIVSGSRDQTIKVWDSGELEPQNACPAKINTSWLSPRHSRAQGDKRERPQQQGHKRCLQPCGWQDDCVRLLGQDDQSLARVEPETASLLVLTAPCLPTQPHWS
jgi:WD40 repeat protein